MLPKQSDADLVIGKLDAIFGYLFPAVFEVL